MEMEMQMEMKATRLGEAEAGTIRCSGSDRLHCVDGISLIKLSKL